MDLFDNLLDSLTFDDPTSQDDNEEVEVLLLEIIKDETKGITTDIPSIKIPLFTYLDKDVLVKIVTDQFVTEMELDKDKLYILPNLSPINNLEYLTDLVKNDNYFKSKYPSANKVKMTIGELKEIYRSTNPNYNLIVGLLQG